MPKEKRQALFLDVQRQLGKLGDHMVETIYQFERGALAREDPPSEVERITNPTPSDLLEAQRNSGVNSSSRIVFIVKARKPHS